MALEPVTAALHLGQAQEQFDACQATLRVRNYAVDEGLNRLFTVVLDIDVSWPEPFDLSALRAPRPWLGLTTTFGLSRTGRIAAARHWVGVVSICEILHAGASRSISLRLTIVPHLQLLAHEQDSEIYINHSARQILQRLLGEGLAPHSYRLVGIGGPDIDKILEARIRHQESRLDGLHRLMNDFGLGYWITSEPVAANESDSGYRPLIVVFQQWQHLGGLMPEAHVVLPLVAPGSGADAAAAQCLHSLTTSEALGPRVVSLYSLDVTRLDMPEAFSGTSLHLPGTSLGTIRQSKKNLRQRPAGEKKTERIHDVRATAWASHLMSDASQGTSGQSDALNVMPGARLSVADAQDGPDYLVTALRHVGSDNLNLLDSQAGAVAYSNLLDLAALPGPETGQHQDAPAWLSRLQVPEAVPLGLHSATVLGRDSQDELPYVDAAGRILVKVHGMHHTVPKDTCMSPGIWVRVAQTWAGAGIGSFFWPQPGFEVLLAFMGGYDGEPMVLGCAYNALNEPPYNHFLAQRSGFKTHKRGNELSFFDAQGREEVKLEATRTLNVKANELMTLKVGFANLWRNFLAAVGTLEGLLGTQLPDILPKPFVRALNACVDLGLDLKKKGFPADIKSVKGMYNFIEDRGNPFNEVLDAWLPFVHDKAGSAVVDAIQTCQEYIGSIHNLYRQITDFESGRTVHTASFFGTSETTVTRDCSLEVKQDAELEVGNMFTASAAEVHFNVASGLSLQQKDRLGAAAFVTLERGDFKAHSVVVALSARQQLTIQQGACTIVLHGGRVHIRAPKFDVDADDITLKGRKSVTIKSPKTSIH